MKDQLCVFRYKIRRTSVDIGTKMVRGKVKAALDRGYKVVVVLPPSGKTNKLLIYRPVGPQSLIWRSGQSAFHGRAGLDRAFSMLLKDLHGAFVLSWQIPIITNDESAVPASFH